MPVPLTIARRGISHVPEGRRVFRDLTVRENWSWGPRPTQRPAEEMEADMARMFKLFRIWKRLKSAPGWTSSRRAAANVGLARGLCAAEGLLMTSPPSPWPPSLSRNVPRDQGDQRTGAPRFLLVETERSMALASRTGAT